MRAVVLVTSPLTAPLAPRAGAATFLNGIVPRVVYIGPSCAIFFMVYESVKNIDF